MSRRVEIYLLVALLLVAGLLFVRDRMGSPGAPSGGVLVSSTKFVPLDIREPDLRLDLLEKIHHTKYSGLDRDIFSGQPLPHAQPKVIPTGDRGPTGARPSGPPPLQVPVQFFGYASPPGSSERVAFFLNGEDVLIVAEGDTLLGNFRLLHIGNASAQVQEMSTGRQTSIPLEQPPDESMIP